MKSHQKSSIGNATIEEYMLRDYNKPKDFESFLYVGQVLQAKGITTGIKAHRRNMPFCMGSLYWQINDCWPVASWSSTDYYGKWKALHYSVKKAFKTNIISVTKNNQQTYIYIISDSTENFKAELSMQIIDFNGNVTHKVKKEIAVQQNKSKFYYSLSNNLIKKTNIYNTLLHTVLANKKGEIIDENIHYFVAPKDLNLAEPKLNITFSEKNNKLYLIISTDVLAKNIYLSTDETGMFSDNYFDLLPNSSKTIQFKGNKKTSIESLKNNLKVISLYNSYN